MFYRCGPSRHLNQATPGAHSRSNKTAPACGAHQARFAAMRAKTARAHAKISIAIRQRRQSHSGCDAATQAIIEFDMQGKILTANENFCSALGYALSEIVGQHHRLFVDPPMPQARTTGSSGRASGAANSTAASTSGLERGAGKSGSRLPIIRFSRDRNLLKSSSLPLTSPQRS